MTESEISALSQGDTPLPSSSSPPTTTAPEGAPIEEVRAGISQHDDVPQGNAPYAEGGSLAKELAKEKEEREQKEKGKGKEKAEAETGGGEV